MANTLVYYDEILADSFANYLSLSKSIGGLIQQQSDLVKKAVDTQRSYIDLSSRSKKPGDSQLMSLLKPTSELITQIQALRDNLNRKDELFNHLSAIAEGISALGWVTVVPTPGPYVKEMKDSAQFYTNKVLISFKDKDLRHVNWAKSWIQFLTELQAFVRKHHTTGLVWNAQGNEISCASAPPPPPPPAAGFFDDISSAVPNQAPGADSRAALFASLNKGTEITKALRKVDSEQMTHKNPSLRQGNVPDRNGKGQNGIVATKSVPAKLPPKFELEGKKWLVENQSGNSSMTISDTSMSQSVSIYNCNDSLLVVKGKVNSITVNKCKKFSIIFDNIVSVVEFIDSQRLKAQVNGIVPTITVDKVDGIEVYLGKDSLSCEIVSSKSSEINVSVPDKNDEYVEHPLPEQFKSLWSGNGFKTEAVDKN